MNGLFKFLSPFAPDQSGAVSVLFSLGGIVVICDAGGCAGNICGFDEPRWFCEKSAVFSAGLRDIDAILGRDERLVQKLEEAVKFSDAKFAAIVGTPVPAVIGTDFRALRRMAEARLGIPVLALDTTGIAPYDEGEEKAYLALLSAFAKDNPKQRFEVGVFGATPLNLPHKNYARTLKTLLEEKYGKVSLFTGENGIADIQNAGAAKLNIAVSASGIKPCEYLKQRFGTEYRVEFPVGEIKDCGVCRADKPDNKQARKAAQNPEFRPQNRTLVVQQQVLANSLRNALEMRGQTADVATWFKLNRNYARENDIRLAEEDDFLALIRERNYGRIIADPIFKRALADYSGEFIPLCHYACSGELFAGEAQTAFENLAAYLEKQQ